MAAGDVKYYDPDEYSIRFGVVDLNQGLADGEFISVEWDADMFQDVVGTDGEVTRSKSNDLRATVTLKLMQTSNANLILSGFLLADRAKAGGTSGVIPFLMSSGLLNERYFSANAWIMNEPSASYDRTATSREWKIRCAKLIRVPVFSALIPLL